MTALTDLIERVEAFDTPKSMPRTLTDTRMISDMQAVIGHGSMNETNKLLYSLDAVISLINERLPGALRTLASGDGSSYAHITTADRAIQAGGEAKTDACALLIAALKAMEPS